MVEGWGEGGGGRWGPAAPRLRCPGPGEAMPGPVGRRQPGATEEAAIYLRLITNQEPTLAACLLIGTGRREEKGGGGEGGRRKSGGGGKKKIK